MIFLLLKTSLRNLKGLNKFSILNIIGLSIGFTFVGLITLFVFREVSYDQFQKKADSICLLETLARNDDGTIQKGKSITLNQVEAIKTQLPGVSNVTFLNYSYFDWDNGTWLKFDNQLYQLPKMAFTNASFADVFSFPTVSGDLKRALDDPLSLVLTEENAKKIFGNQNPIGKNVLLNNRPVTVKAVVDARSSGSSIRFDGLINYQAAQYFVGHAIDDYSNLAFLEIDKNTELKSIERASAELFLHDLPLEKREAFRSKLNINLIPLKDSYFSEGSPFDPLRHGNKMLVVLIIAIGGLILILAIINYFNLSFASSFKRHKALAIQSISGASRSNIVLQFISEGILISAIAFILSILFSGITLPWFNQMIDYQLSAKDLFQPRFAFVFIALVLFVGAISGILPALSATQLSPVDLFKGDNKKMGKYQIWRYLVLFQMVISIALITGTLVVGRQIHFVRNIDMGFETNNVVTLPVHKLGDTKNAYLELVKSNSQTEGYTLSTSYLNTFNEWGGTLNEKGQEKEISYFVIQANADFLNTTGIRLVEGRNFEKERTSGSKSCLINEATVKQYGITDPLSAKISGNAVVGVVKDFHIQSLHNQIGLVVILNSPQNKTGLATIKFKAANSAQVTEFLAFLKTNWEKFAADKPFEYEFIDQRLRNMYDKEERLMKVFSSFSVLAIIIACLGLFGLISFMAETKIKEIGIRKINGAKVSEVMTMLNRDFVKWVAIAFIIATPIAYYAMNRWLESFAYKTDLSWWIFALAGLLALGIALLTVSWQSWKAATRNPVEALKYE
jgi:putative ABC transport system permease protein